MCCFWQQSLGYLLFIEDLCLFINSGPLFAVFDSGFLFPVANTGLLSVVSKGFESVWTFLPSDKGSQKCLIMISFI